MFAFRRLDRIINCLASAWCCRACSAHAAATMRRVVARSERRPPACMAAWVMCASEGAEVRQVVAGGGDFKEPVLHGQLTK